MDKKLLEVLNTICIGSFSDLHDDGILTGGIVLEDGRITGTEIYKTP